MAKDDNNFFGNSTCRVEISTHGDESFAAKDYFTGTGDQQEIRSCQISKMAGDPCGSFSFNIVPKTQDWLKIIRPDDWVTIYMDNGRDGAEEKVMVGTVDTIRRQRQVVDQKSGAEEIAITVAGRDCGKPLLEIDPFLDPKLTLSLDGITFMNHAPLEVRKRFAYPADAMVKRILDVYFDPKEVKANLSSQFTNPSGEIPFYKQNGTGTLRLDMKSNKKFQVIIGALPNLSQSMWALIDQYANRLLNQLFVEMIKTEDSSEPHPTLYMRQFPFSVGDFFDMDVFELQQHETMSDDLGFSSHEIKNWFRVESSIFNTNQPTNIGAITRLGYINPESVKRHGLKRADYENMYSQISEERSSSLESIRAMTDLVAEWHWNAENMLNGQITCRLRPDCRLQKRIDYTDEDDTLSFINEGYSHNWTYQGASSTTISVSRGISRIAANSKLKDKDTLIKEGILTPLTKYDPVTAKDLKAQATARDKPGA